MLPTEIMHAREEWSEIFKGLKEWGVAKRANQEDHDLNFLHRLESTYRTTINEKDLQNSAKDFPQQKKYNERITKRQVGETETSKLTGSGREPMNRRMFVTAGFSPRSGAQNPHPAPQVRQWESRGQNARLCGPAGLAARRARGL